MKTTTGLCDLTCTSGLLGCIHTSHEHSRNVFISNTVCNRPTSQCGIIWKRNAIFYAASTRFSSRSNKYQLSLKKATRCTTENVLQTKVDAHCDKLATEVSWPRLRRLAFLSYSKLSVESRQFQPTAPAFGASVGGDRVWVLPRFSATEN